MDLLKTKVAKNYATFHQLEKLEAARSAYLCLPLFIFGYLWLPLVTFGYLWLPLVTFGYLSWPY